MTNFEHIKSLDKWQMAQFLKNVADNCEKITVCENECAKCECSDSWCVSNIGEWLNEKAGE